MREVLLFGTTYFTSEVYYYVSKRGYKVKGTIVDADYYETDYYNGIKVYSFDIIQQFFDMKEVSILLSLGYKRMNKTREEVFLRCREKGYKIATFIDPDAQVCTDKIGVGNIILGRTYIGPGTSVGDGNVFKNQTYIDHDVVIGNYNFFACSKVAGAVNIGNNNLMGFESVIKDSLLIGNSNVIGVGTCVKKNMSQYQIASVEGCNILQTSEKNIEILL